MKSLVRVFYNDLALGICVIVLAVLAAVGLFFLFRAITLWYFKINAMLKELKKANAYLARIAAAAESPRPVMMQQGHPAMPVQGMPVQPPMQGAVMQSAAPASVFRPGAAVVAPEAVSEAPNTSAPAPAAAPVQAEMTPAQETKRTCVKCGAVLQEDANFCMECGTKN